MTYTDYLQRRELDSHLAFQISQPIKELITRSDHIGDEQLVQLQRIEAAQAETTEAVYRVVEAVDYLRVTTEEGFRRVGAILEWGFTELIVQQTRTNDLLSDILLTLKTPSVTWAYEQFERARDRYRRRHLAEALESLDKAINGHASELGEKTEHRFHYLTGIIKLGSFQNHDENIVDLPGAEQCFLTAARYAKHDYPVDAAKSLLCACRAANLQGRYNVASEYAVEGLSNADLAGLHYELAVALINLSEFDRAAFHFCAAIRLEKLLLLRASGDPNFTAFDPFLKDNMTILLAEARDIAQRVEIYISTELDRFENVEFLSAATCVTYKLRDICSQVSGKVGQYIKEVRQRTGNGGILDIRETLEQLPDLSADMLRCNDRFRSEVTKRLSDSLSSMIKSEKDILSEQNRVSKSLVLGLGKVPVVGAIVAGLGSWVYFDAYGDFNPAEKFMMTLSISIGFVFVGYWLAAGFAAVVTELVRRASADRNVVAETWANILTRSIARERASVAKLSLYSPASQLSSVIPFWVHRRTDGLR